MAKRNTDTVPAMLTPGEFVIKKESAKKIGYDNLNKINKTGKINTKREAKMPQGKGTYGSQKGRPKKKVAGYKDGGRVSSLDISPIDPRAGIKGTGANTMGGIKSPNPRLGLDNRDDVEFDEDSLSPGLNLMNRGVRGYNKGGKVTSEGYSVHGQSSKYKVGK